MRAPLFTVLLIANFTTVSLAADAGLKAKVSITSSKRSYRLGEPIQVRYLIENVGGMPFYIPKEIDSVGNARGG